LNPFRIQSGEKIRAGRWRDAFHAFGHLWFSHARENALRTIPACASKEARAVAVEAVDAALYNTMMIFDGIVAARPDATHTVGFSLTAQVREAASHDCIESFELAPNGEESTCMGFHLWAEGDFRS
jgi:hypothetical protein